MTLERPAYTVTVTNLDTAWTQTVTAGDVVGPAAGIYLTDALSLTWRFTDAPPAQLEPESARFSIVVDGIANLPSFQEGDRVTVSLQRPTDADPITYMDFAGRITDRDLITTAKTGRLLLTLTAVDPTSELTHEVDNGAPDTVKTYVPWLDAILRYEVGRGYIYDPGVIFQDANFNRVNCVASGTDKAIDLITKTLAGGLYQYVGGIYSPVQRYVEPDLSPGLDYFSYQYYGEPAPDSWGYYLARWLPALDGTLQTFFVYQFSAADADRVTVAPTTDPIDPAGAVIALDAAYMADGARWISDRTAAPNRVELTGLDTTTGDGTAAATRTDTLALQRFGAITRKVETTVTPGERGGQAALYLALCPTSSAESWQLSSTPIYTDLMDDETLDAYAPLFWTPRSSTDEPLQDMGRPAVVVNVDADVDATGGYLLAHLAGVNFTAQAGDLVITPELVPARLPTVEFVTSDSPTFDAFGASSFGNATYHDAGGSTDYIDQDLTYEKAKFTSL